MQVVLQKITGCRAALMRSEARVLPVLCFLAVFCSSIVGAKVGPLPLGLAGFVPLFLFLALTARSYIVDLRNPYPWFCFALGFSSLFALARSFPQYPDYLSACVSLPIELIGVMLPIFFLTRDRPGFKDVVRRSFVYVARIHLVWAFIQYVTWSFFGIDWNELILVDVLGGLGRDSWTATSNLFIDGSDQFTNTLRLTGINADGAYLGIILFIGFLFEKPLVLRAAYLLCVLISMQRSSLVVFAAVIAVELVLYIRRSAKVRLSRNQVIGIVALAIAVLTMVILIPQVNSRITVLLGRFSFLVDGFDLTNENDIGTYRHLMYVPVSLTQLFSVDPGVFFCGMGFKNSGLLLSAFPNVLHPYLNDFMLTNRWLIESDIASVIAGAGVFGILTYIWLYVRMFRSGDRTDRLLILGFLLFGFMYSFSHILFIQLLYITALMDAPGAQEVQDAR